MNTLNSNLKSKHILLAGMYRAQNEAYKEVGCEKR